VAASTDDDPRNWRVAASDEHLALYLELSERPRDLTASEAALMVELVDAWRAQEHRKHIALMVALAAPTEG
jgi:hypothetical protein